MNKEEKQKAWSKKIAEFKKSGKSKEEWCKKKNISTRQLNYWLRQIPGEDTTTQWLPIEIKEEKMPKSSAISVKIGSAIIEVHAGFDKDHLSEVLKVLITL